MIVHLLKELKPNAQSSKTRATDINSLAFTIAKISARKGKVRFENGRHYFREKQKGDIIEIDGQKSDGYDYVYQKGDKIYVFNSLITYFLRYGREFILDEDWELLEQFSKTLTTKTDET